MKKRIKGLFLLIGLISCLEAKQSGITHLDQWGGRLGDKLMIFAKAKWVAFKLNLPFFYKPFPLSDQFMMHTSEKPLNAATNREYTPHITYEKIPSFNHIDPNSGALYTIHYYFTVPEWGIYQETYDSQEICEWPDMLTNQPFLDQLRKSIWPRFAITTFTPSSDKLSVAIHIRKGGGFDHPFLSPQLYDKNDLNPHETTPEGTYSDKVWPLKFPPLQYYIDQLIRLSEMYHDIPMYTHIYTDDRDPIAILNSIKQAVNKSNITYGCRTETNTYTTNVLEDMFSIANYDCLIRSASNFPQISQLVGHHRIVIYPKSRIWIGNTMIIDEVGTFIRK